MAGCKICKAPLKGTGLVWYCTNCGFRQYNPEFYNLDEMRRDLVFETSDNWSTWTLTNCSITGNTITLDSGQTEGTALSPLLIQSDIRVERKKNITKVKLVFSKTGDVKFAASNDNGTNWITITNSNSLYHLPDGTYDKQSIYYSFVVKAVLTTGATPPVLTKLTIFYNKVDQ